MAPFRKDNITPSKEKSPDGSHRWKGGYIWTLFAEKMLWEVLKNSLTYKVICKDGAHLKI